MKKLVSTLILCAICSFSIHAEEQESETQDRLMSISISPIAVISGEFSLMYQIKLTNFVTLTVPAEFRYPWFFASSLALYDSSYTGLRVSKTPLSGGAGIGFRFLPANKGLNNSFYIEPRVTFNYSQFGIEVPVGGFSYAYTTATLLGRLGYDLYAQNGFYFSIGFGLGYAFFLQKNVTGGKTIQDSFLLRSFLGFPSSSPTGQFAWDIELKMGYAW